MTGCISPFQGSTRLFLYVGPGATVPTKSGLAPGYHISRRWRFVTWRDVYASLASVTCLIGT
jgi:hypothetical protein